MARQVERRKKTTECFGFKSAGFLVPKRGLEPRPSGEDYTLNVARLPIPPLRHGVTFCHRIKSLSISTDDMEASSPRAAFALDKQEGDWVVQIASLRNP